MNRMNLLRLFTIIGLLATLGVISVVDGSGQSRKDRREAERLVKEGDKAFNARNYKLAVDHYSKAIALVPNNAYAHFWKGLAHNYLKEDDQALTHFDTALKQGYRRPLDIYLVRWRIHYAKNNLDAALADVQQGFRLDPQNQAFLVALGDINLARRSYDDALDAYQKAVLKVPNNADIYYSIARTKAGMGDAAGQLSAAEEAVKRRTLHLGESLFLIGDAYQKQGKAEAALDAYNRALSAKPDLYEAYRQMAELHRSQGRFNDAIEISRKGLKIFPNDGQVYTDLAWYYSLADRHEEAVQAAEAGIRLLPNEHMAYTNLCRAFNDLNRPERAVAACNNALRLSPDDGETYFYLGRAYELAGRRSDAARAYKKAVTGLVDFTSKNTTYSDGFYLLGNAYASDNQNEKAIEAYQKALELSPRFAKARYNLGIIQVLQNNKAAALQQYNDLTTLDPVLAGKLKAEIDKM